MSKSGHRQGGVGGKGVSGGTKRPGVHIQGAPPGERWDSLGGLTGSGGGGDLRGKMAKIQAGSSGAG